MCGICGIALSDRSSRTLSAALLERMRDTMTHRGPDGAGLHIDGPIGFGHRRLSIIDVAGGAQPMMTDSGRLVITYNGEIYNHPVLKAELEAEGCHYRTRCDTETVLHLVERRPQGAGATPGHVRVRDLGSSDQGTHPSARPPRGEAAVLRACARRVAVFRFGSQGTPCRRSAYAGAQPERAARVPRKPRRHGRRDTLRGHSPATPGHLLIWREGQITIQRYWDLSFAHVVDDGRPDAQWVEEFQRAV